MAIQQTLKYEADVDKDFGRWVAEAIGGEKIQHCIQCGTCSSSCPLSFYMDYPPRQLIYLAREGFKEEVLGSFTIWLCASCYECTVQCPKGIAVTDIMYSLKQRAIQERRAPKGFSIPILAREFFKMVRRNGRTSEIRLVLRLFLKTKWWQMWRMRRLGWGLLRTGRFSLKKESIRNPREIAALLDAVGNGKEVVR